MKYLKWGLVYNFFYQKLSMYLLEELIIFNQIKFVANYLLSAASYGIQLHIFLMGTIETF